MCAELRPITATIHTIITDRNWVVDSYPMDTCLANKAKMNPAKIAPKMIMGTGAFCTASRVAKSSEMNSHSLQKTVDFIGIFILMFQVERLIMTLVPVGLSQRNSVLPSIHNPLVFKTQAPHFRRFKVQ